MLPWKSRKPWQFSDMGSQGEWSFFEQVSPGSADVGRRFVVESSVSKGIFIL